VKPCSVLFWFSAEAAVLLEALKNISARWERSFMGTARSQVLDSGAL
jgi:hypothetical protein